MRMASKAQHAVDLESDLIVSAVTPRRCHGLLEVKSFRESRSSLEVSVNGPLAIRDCVDE